MHKFSLRQLPSLSHPTTNNSYASNGPWHDNMLKQAMLIVNHHQRISHRENYLAVAISKRDCFLSLGVILGTDLLWKIFIGGGGSRHGGCNIVGFCVCFGDMNFWQE
jgi:hypothetical protein